MLGDDGARFRGLEHRWNASRYFSIMINASKGKQIRICEQTITNTLKYRLNKCRQIVWLSFRFSLSFSILFDKVFEVLQNYIRKRNMFVFMMISIKVAIVAYTLKVYYICICIVCYQRLYISNTCLIVIERRTNIINKNHIKPLCARSIKAII